MRAAPMRIDGDLEPKGSVKLFQDPAGNWFAEFRWTNGQGWTSTYQTTRHNNKNPRFHSAKPNMTERIE